MFGRWFRKKDIQHINQHASLLRSLSAFDLTLMGIGAIIGAGVFILTGIAAATKAGPAVSISYTIAGLAALFAAFSYAELAASVGGTGSAYSYAYAGFGELIAWIIGWNLLLEYTMSVATVAIGWSGYADNFLTAIHMSLPTALTKNIFEGGIINLPAMLIIVAISYLLYLGVKQSARFNAAVVFIKLFTIGLFITIATMHINTANWHPYFPFGWAGVMEGAALVFFAYIGFDALSTTVEEAIEPQRNIPIGIITSLIICTLIYIIVSALLTGITPYQALNVSSPVSQALLNIGQTLASSIIAVGAIAGLTTVMLVMFYGLTRICLAIARDGLLPSGLSHIHQEKHTPARIILLMGLVMAVIAGLSPIDKAAELVNIGTLAAFTFVCGGVIVLRWTHPEMPRPFKLPLTPYTPSLGVLCCLYLMYNLPGITWWRFLLWTIFGLFIYFLYGQRHSILNKE